MSNQFESPRWNSVYFLFTLLAIAAGSAQSVGASKKTTIAVRDIHGRLHQPLQSRGKKATVLVFITHDCPIANSYAPEIQRIRSKYAAQRIALYLVYTDKELSAAQARRHAQEFGYHGPALLDPKHQLVKVGGATVTPEAVVFAANDKLVYRGRIDDKYAAYGKARRQATKHDLREALDAVLKKKPPSKPVVTAAIGCFI